MCPVCQQETRALPVGTTAEGRTIWRCQACRTRFVRGPEGTVALPDDARLDNSVETL